MKRDLNFCYQILKQANESTRNPLDQLETAFGLDAKLLLEDENFRTHVNALLSEGYLVKAADHFNDVVSTDICRFVRITWKGLRFLEVFEECEKMSKFASSDFEVMLCRTFVLLL